MTRLDAQREARRILGCEIYAREFTGANYAGRTQNRCYLLRRKITKTVVHEYVGMGPTWEAALIDAQKGRIRE
jgi:PP-loop superfamily ATP-utilizing enzyme